MEVKDYWKGNKSKDIQFVKAVLSHGPSHRGYTFSSINVREGFLVYIGQRELLTKNCGENCSGESAGPNTMKTIKVAWTYIKKK